MSVIVCGDSGNDLGMFESGFKGIIVGNAQDELKDFQGRMPIMRMRNTAPASSRVWSTSTLFETVSILFEITDSNTR